MVDCSSCNHCPCWYFWVDIGMSRSRVRIHSRAVVLRYWNRYTRGKNNNNKNNHICIHRELCICVYIPPLSLFVFLSVARELFIISSIHSSISSALSSIYSVAHRKRGICSPVVLFRSVIENDKIISIDNDEASHSITTMIAQLTRTSYIQRETGGSYCVRCGARKYA